MKIAMRSSIPFPTGAQQGRALMVSMPATMLARVAQRQRPSA
jgi:hypothetical protein